MRPVGLGLVLVASVAQADSPPIAAQIEPPTSSGVTVAVDHVPRTHPLKFTLEIGSASAEPASVRSQAKTSLSMTIALVYPGYEAWIGNDDYETDATERWTGNLKLLQQALDGSPLAAGAPKDSEFFAVSYTDTPRLRVPLEPLSAMTSAQLGPQREYHAQIGADLPAAVAFALDHLETNIASRKVLLVVADGFTDHPEALAALKERAAKDHIELRGIVVLSIAAYGVQGIPALLPDAKASTLPGAFVDLAGDIAGRLYVHFPTDDLPFDGAPHELIVKMDGRELTRATLRLPPVPKHHWWWQIGAGIGIVGFAALALRSQRRRS